MKFKSYLVCGFATTLNVILYALTGGRFLWLEGRVRGGVFSNWGKRFRYRPKRFVQPRTEEEIVEIVREAKELRLFGSAHSFNPGVVADDTLVSLDNYSGVIDRQDLGDRQMAFKGGTRIRDVAKLLLDAGLAFSSLPSHDAQSIGGILSTDVHGTGRDWGFVSQLVVKLKVIDGEGNVKECVPSDELFKAAIGGIGAAGIISEVVVQAVDRFNVEQKVELSNLSFVRNNFDSLFAANEHLSLYLFPFTDRCQINTWNYTKRKKSFLGTLREFLSISVDALLSAWAGNLMAYTGLLPRLSTFAHSIRRGTNLVLESNKAYNRTIYHFHQELEYTVPFEDTFEACRQCIELYENMYREGLPYSIFEIRFTPAGHDTTLIGAGRERRSTWIDIVICDSTGFERYYAAVEELMKRIGARPHLGKFCQSFGKEEMAKLHQQNFNRFLEIRERQDPHRKFINDFTRRLFGD